MTTIFKIEKPHRPEWNEDFIERLRGVKTDLAGFKKILEKEILDEKEYRQRAKDEEELLNELIKITEIEVGPGLIKAETDRLFSEQKQNIEGQGYNMKAYLEHLKQDEETYKKETLESEAKRRVSAEIILKKVREIFAVESTEEEINAEIEKIISQYQNKEVIERLKKKLVPGDTYYEDIKTRLAYRKVVDRFFE